MMMATVAISQYHADFGKALRQGTFEDCDSQKQHVLIRGLTIMQHTIVGKPCCHITVGPGLYTCQRRIH